jgi:uncharacterized membrane protein YcaP (DUF421 family)
MWFDGWSEVLRVVTLGSLAYLALVVFLRLSGKRTLAKMNAFDFVVTVSLGSTLATVLLSSSVAFASGVTALALLVVLQYGVARAYLSVPPLRRLVKAEPTLLIHDGRLLHDALRHQRLAPEEVLQALRHQGIADVEEVAAMVLETDGSISVLKTAAPGATAMANVAGWPVQPPA